MCTENIELGIARPVCGCGPGVGTRAGSVAPFLACAAAARSSRAAAAAAATVPSHVCAAGPPDVSPVLQIANVAGVAGGSTRPVVDDFPAGAFRAERAALVASVPARGDLVHTAAGSARPFEQHDVARLRGVLVHVSKLGCVPRCPAGLERTCRHRKKLAAAGSPGEGRAIYRELVLLPSDVGLVSRETSDTTFGGRRSRHRRPVHSRDLLAKLGPAGGVAAQIARVRRNVADHHHDDGHALGRTDCRAEIGHLRRRRQAIITRFAPHYGQRSVGASRCGCDVTGTCTVVYSVATYRTQHYRCCSPCHDAPSRMRHYRWPVGITLLHPTPGMCQAALTALGVVLVPPLLARLVAFHPMSNAYL